MAKRGNSKRKSRKKTRNLSIYNQKLGLGAYNHFKIYTLIVQSCLSFKRVIMIWSSFKQFHNLYADCKMIGQSCLLFKRIKGASSNNIKSSLLSPDLQFFLKHACNGISRFSFLK